MIVAASGGTHSSEAWEGGMDVRDCPSRVLVLGVIGTLAIVGTACSSTTEPGGEERRLGVIVGFNDDDPQIAVPDTIEAGVEFVVEVTTYGNACFRKGETEVASSGNSVTITPYDYIDMGAGACADVLLSFIHQATVEVSDAGFASVVIVGRAGGSMEEEVVEGIREVVVLARQVSN